MLGGIICNADYCDIMLW